MSITVIYPAMSLTVLYLAKIECNKKKSHTVVTVLKSH